MLTGTTNFHDLSMTFSNDLVWPDIKSWSGCARQACSITRPSSFSLLTTVIWKASTAKRDTASERAPGGMKKSNCHRLCAFLVSIPFNVVRTESRAEDQKSRAEEQIEASFQIVLCDSSSLFCFVFVNNRWGRRYVSIC